jgi:hypothetical protein
MASQLITVFVHGGLNAQNILQRTAVWSAEAVYDATQECNTWPESSQIAADQFISQLLQSATDQATLYYSQWLDYWSMGDVFQYLTPHHEIPQFTIDTKRYELYQVRLPDAELKQAIHKELPRHATPETRRFVWQIQQALESWEHLCPTAVLLVIRQITGGMLDDTEIQSALSQGSTWSQ